MWATNGVSGAIQGATWGFQMASGGQWVSGGVPRAKGAFQRNFKEYQSQEILGVFQVSPKGFQGYE